MTLSRSDSRSEPGRAGRATDGAMIRLQVNGDELERTPPLSVAALLESLDMGGQRVAVAVNRRVVVRSAYGDTRLADGDRVEILEAVGGG